MKLSTLITTGAIASFSAVGIAAQAASALTIDFDEGFVGTPGDGTIITDWQTDGPLAFEPGSTDLPSGFHELIEEAHIGDSLQALLPPVRAWGMSGLPPDIPQEAVIAVSLRVGLYQRPG